MASRNTFSIGDTARLTGVTQKQIRHWESRRYIEPPIRIICGNRAYRYFEKSEVERIKSIKALLDQGYSLVHAAEMVKKSKTQGGRTR